MTACEIDTKHDFDSEIREDEQDLYHLGMRLTGSEIETSALVRETFMKAHMYRERFSPGTDMHAWLRRILRNSFVNMYRRKCVVA